MSSTSLSSQIIDSGWTLTASGPDVPPEIAVGPIAAEVPGTSHTDLLRAGLIPDPYIDQNEQALAWAWHTTWTYATSFSCAPALPGERIDLVFDGLDTVATVTLNGSEIARTKNMHRTYRFDVAGLLRTDGSDNQLVVRFDSALDHAHGVEAEIGERIHVEKHPFNAIRKMACSFGWDWGPDLQTAGIWKPVRLERWTTARLASVRPLVTVDGAKGMVDLRVDVERAPAAANMPLSVIASVCGLDVTVPIAAGESAATVTVDVPNVDRWWPVGYGSQPLYDLGVVLSPGVLTTGEGSLDHWSRRIGFRSVAVDTTPDERGAGFGLIVNGVRVFVKGANWIPDDHLMTRITRDRLRRRFTQALDANINLLRIWGGGIYESDDFYELADEMGIMIWQDFLFACAAYDEGPAMMAEVEAEVRDNVTRLMPHASLVIYNGSNETIWGFFEFGWSEKIEDTNWGRAYYNEMLPALLSELDPTRSYTPSSPFSPHHSHTEISPNDYSWGTVHEWKVWNQVDYTHYRDDVPRFCSEFGFQGPATWSTLERSLAPEAFDQAHPAWLAHQKADRGNDKLNAGFEPHLPEPSSFEAWHWTTQLNQAHAIEFAITHYRSHWPTCSGAIVWQLNDCWPVTSWAAIDGDERKKPLWYAIKHAYAPRLLTFQPREGELHLVAVNDTDKPWSNTLTFERQTFDGTELAVATTHLRVAPRSTSTITIPPHVREAGDPRGELLVADAGYRGDDDHVRALHTFAEDKDLNLDPAPFTVTTSVQDPTVTRISVSARSFVKDFAVLADKLEPSADASDALVCLLAGEMVHIDITSTRTIEASEWDRPNIWVSVNFLGPVAHAGR